MQNLESLAKRLDDIDAERKRDGYDRSNPLWHEFVRQKDGIVDEMENLLPDVSDALLIVQFLLSPSLGRQTVAVVWIKCRKDPSHLNTICYMLLNCPSNFLTYHVLNVLWALVDQCDYHQLCQLKQTLMCYAPPDGTSRHGTKLRLLETIEPQINYSVCEIIKDTYWWRDVESKFFNSLSGTSQFRLRGLKIIRNKQLFNKFTEYRSRSSSNAQVLYVYHGSSPNSLQAISRNGFLAPEMCATLAHQAPKQLDPGYFGRGIYHGFAADYAIHYAESYKNSDEIMLSMILPGRSYTVKKGGEKFGKTCEPGFDSHISPENKEIVLFKSEQILPLFIIRFERIPNANIAEEPY